MKYELNKEMLNIIGDDVRAGLRFNAEFGHSESDTDGNCYEYAVRTHDQIAGMSDNNSADDRHFIGHAYDHAFNVGISNGRLYIASSDAPSLVASEFDDPAIAQVFGASQIEEMASDQPSQKTLGFMTMHPIARSFSYEELATMNKKTRWYSEVWLGARNPSCAIMTPEYARDALANYMAFRRAVNVRDVTPVGTPYDFEFIRDSLEALRIRTPQHETRPRYNETLPAFKKAVKALAATAISDSDLNALIESYAQILPEANAGSNVIFADCYRTVGASKNSGRAFSLAREMYDLARRHSRADNSLVRAKISKLPAQAAV